MHTLVTRIRLLCAQISYSLLSEFCTSTRKRNHLDADTLNNQHKKIRSILSLHHSKCADERDLLMVSMRTWGKRRCVVMGGTSSTFFHRSHYRSVLSQLGIVFMLYRYTVTRCKLNKRMGKQCLDQTHSIQCFVF